MKKIRLIIVAALAMTLAACGNKSTAPTENATAKESVGENSSKEVTYITYTNEKYGFSVEVPAGMVQKGEAMGDEGTVFSADMDGFALNRIDISGTRQFVDMDYTPAMVKEEFKYWTANKDIASEECGDDYFTYTTKGEMLTEMTYNVYKGNSAALITIYYDAEHEKQLGGEVARHVFSSVKFK